MAQALKAWCLEHVALAGLHTGRGPARKPACGRIRIGQLRYVDSHVAPRAGVLCWDGYGAQFNGSDSMDCGLNGVNQEARSSGIPLGRGNRTFLPPSS